MTLGTGPSSSVSIDAATNRITGTGYGYDANGNMTADGLNSSMVYDAENRLVSLNSGAATYTYDGNNLRVKKIASGTTTVYVFSGSKVIAEYENGAAVGSPSREYIYSGGALVAKIEGSSTQYFHQDHLSNRVVTDSTGSVAEQKGHYPFGESWYEGATPNKLKFTGYERDAESGNDYAMARYHVNRLGRFSSPDPLAGTIGDPQSLNRFAYVRNDPIDLTDPLGFSYMICQLDQEHPSVYNCTVLPNDQFYQFRAGSELKFRDGNIYSGDTLIGTYLDVTSPTAPREPAIPPTDPARGRGDPGGGPGGNSSGFWNGVKRAYCSVVPSGRVVSVGGSAGTLGGVTGSLDVVTNYNSGQVSGFASGGFFAGFNGGGSAGGSYGQIYGNLATDNSNYSGPFKSISGSVGFFGGSVTTAVGGSGPTIVSATGSASMFGKWGFSASKTTSSRPLQMGNFVSGTAPAATVTDYLFYLARRPCS